MQHSYDKEQTVLRAKVSELTTEIEALQLHREHQDQRKLEKDREKQMQQHEQFALQERISNSWKRELEKTSSVYERVISKLKAELS